jgi:hypothetical protein
MRGANTCASTAWSRPCQGLFSDGALPSIQPPLRKSLRRSPAEPGKSGGRSQLWQGAPADAGPVDRRAQLACLRGTRRAAVATEWRKPDWHRDGGTKRTGTFGGRRARCRAVRLREN